jgi:hypothetical protein
MKHSDCQSGVESGDAPAFELAAATVPGRAHQLAGRNNQDAFVVRRWEGGFVAVVCDGCGSSPRSEVGALAGSGLVAAELLRGLEAGEDPAGDSFWDNARERVLARLAGLADALGGDRVQTVLEYLLFTAVGAVGTRDTVCAFSAGDGVLAVNGEVLHLEPLPGNEPPYLAYALLPRRPRSIPEELLRFHVHRRLPARELRTLLAGTDGAGELARLADRPLPGAAERVAPVEALFHQDLLFRNPDALRRYLARVGRDRARVERGALVQQAGLLQDDTTLVLVRRAGGRP